MDEQDEAGALEVLGREECFALLAARSFGRLGVVARGYPLIVPVNYGVDRGAVVVRTHPGTALAAADHANVCFEVDELDPLHRGGWSVLVRGLAEDVTDLEGAEVLRRSRESAVEPWAPGEHGRWLRVLPHEVTGRRIRPGVPVVELGGYL